MKPILLFLDFDGVLHSKYSSQENYFSKLQYFEETIRAHENVNIVDYSENN